MYRLTSPRHEGKAERGGFEPAVRFDPHTAFPVPHNRPLCHLSERNPKFEPRMEHGSNTDSFACSVRVPSVAAFFLGQILPGFSHYGKFHGLLVNWKPN